MPSTYRATKLTVLDEKEVYLASIAGKALPQGEKQREMIIKLLNLGMFKQLAEMVLLRDQI